MATEKRCVRCEAVKPTSEFHKRAKARDGLNPACKDCLRIDRARRRALSDEDRAMALSTLVNRESKCCALCKVERARVDFRGSKASRDGMVGRCKACEAAWRRQHYLANRDGILAQSRAWAAANVDRRNSKSREWYRANREAHYANQRRWVSENREWVTEFMRRRRAAIAGSVTGPVDLDALWTGRCGICDGEMDRTIAHPDPLSKSVDHIMPISRGGTHTQDNLQWAHLVCNMSKGARIDEAVA